MRTISEQRKKFNNITWTKYINYTTEQLPGETHGLKNGYCQLLNAADLVVNGKTTNQCVNNIYIYLYGGLHQRCL